MSEPARFLFDECIGKPSMLELKKMVPNSPEFAHLCDTFGQGTADNVWVPKAAAEGRWILITADGGKKPNIGDKLPELCKEHKVTHVILSQKLHRRKAHEKIAALLAAWDQIEALAKEPPGTRFNLRFGVTKGTGALHIELKKAAE